MIYIYIDIDIYNYNYISYVITHVSTIFYRFCGGFHGFTITGQVTAPRRRSPPSAAALRRWPAARLGRRRPPRRGPGRRRCGGPAWWPRSSGPKRAWGLEIWGYSHGIAMG